MRLAVLISMLSLLSACHSPPPEPAPEASLAADISAAAYTDTFNRAVAVLREQGFVVNRQDHRFGRITTQPKGAPTVFEPWKADNRSLREALRATLGDLQRTVTVTLEPPEATPEAHADPAWVPPASPELSTQAEMYRLRVEVLVERLQVPERRLNGRTAGSVFDDLDETPAELQDRGLDGRYWQSVGRDKALERYLLDRIVPDPK